MTYKGHTGRLTDT